MSPSPPPLHLEGLDLPSSSLVPPRLLTLSYHSPPPSSLPPPLQLEELEVLMKEDIQDEVRSGLGGGGREEERERGGVM